MITTNKRKSKYEGMTCARKGCNLPAMVKGECRKHYNASLYAENPEKHREYQREYHLLYRKATRANNRYKMPKLVREVKTLSHNPRTLQELTPEKLAKAVDMISEGIVTYSFR